MAERITREDAARVAALAKLALTDGELDRAARQLEAMLSHFGAIAKIDTRGIEPAVASAAPAPLRSDDPRPSLSAAETFGNAPDANIAARLFRVPRVLGS